MAWDIIENIESYSTIGSNFITIIWGIWGLLTLFYFYWSKKYKAMVVSSKTFQIPLEKEDINKAIYPKKILDETVELKYDKNLLSPKDFCIQNKEILSEIKEKYDPICVFWVAEMFIFFWIWYFLQDSIHIRWFRKLKDDALKFSWNPWSWTSFLSLKWILYFEWLFEGLINRYREVYVNASNWEEIVLIINISHEIKQSDIPEDLRNLKIFNFWIKKTNSSFLINESQVITFAKKIKKIMRQIDKQIGANWRMHIFWSLPVPFCIKLWQSIHRNWPECILYDFNKTTRSYIQMISTKDFTI